MMVNNQLKIPLEDHLSKIDTIVKTNAARMHKIRTRAGPEDDQAHHALMDE
jgi:hypothetical protein